MRLLKNILILLKIYLVSLKTFLSFNVQDRAEQLYSDFFFISLKIIILSRVDFFSPTYRTVHSSQKLLQSLFSAKINILKCH